jgi:hypothetical protein
LDFVIGGIDVNDEEIMKMFLIVLERVMNFGDVLLVADRLNEIRDLFVMRDVECEEEEKRRLNFWMERATRELAEIEPICTD